MMLSFICPINAHCCYYSYNYLYFNGEALRQALNLSGLPFFLCMGRHDC